MGRQHLNPSHFIGVPKFNSTFGEVDYRRHVSASNSNLLPRDLTISLEAPNFVSIQPTTEQKRIGHRQTARDMSAYTDRLLKEIALHGNMFGKDRRVTQINFSAGFANLLAEPTNAEVLDEIAAQFHLDVPSKLSLCHEITESRNSASLISKLNDLGFNKYSICTNGLLQHAHKTRKSHAASQFLEAIQTAHNKGSAVEINFAVDSRLAGTAELELMLSQLIDLGVGQINITMPYRTRDRKKQQSDVKPSLLLRLKHQSNKTPDKATLDDTNLLHSTRERLRDAGYMQLGLDQFCLPTNELAIAQQQGSVHCDISGRLTTRNTDYVGIGVAAVSQMNTAYAKNQSKYCEYNESLNQNLLPIEKGVVLSPDHRIRAAIVKEVICRNCINLENSIGRYIDLPTTTTLRDYFSQELGAISALANENLITVSKAGLEITDEGLDHKLQIAAIFDPQANPKQSKAPVHLFK